MAEASRRRSALLFALDVTGGPDVVYRVAVYLQELLRRLNAAPGFTTRARIDLMLFDAQMAQMAPPERLISSASQMAGGAYTAGARLRPIIEQAKQLTYEGGGFHTFLLMTRDLLPGWEEDLVKLHQLVASVTGLSCGPEANPTTVARLSKEPGGTRIVNPLDVIRLQFDSIAAWLIDNFADRPPVLAVTHPMNTEPLPPEEPASTSAEPTTGPLPIAWRNGAWWSLPIAVTRPSISTRKRIPGWAGWGMVAASRRGKLHAHEGRYRDDEFALGTHKGWNLLAVADGAGSCRLSRVGARIATAAAIAAMSQGVDRHWLAAIPEHAEPALKALIVDGLRGAHAAVHAEAKLRNIPVRDLSSTLLLLAHSPPMQAQGNGTHYLGAGQIGDGMILTVGSHERVEVLGEASKGFYSGETTFLPGLTPAELERFAWGYVLETPPAMVLAMTDGIADDLVPLARQVPTLLRGITSALQSPKPDLALLETIAYEKRDSADDRTLAVLYRFEGV